MCETDSPSFEAAGTGAEEERVRRPWGWRKWMVMGTEAEAEMEMQM